MPRSMTAEELGLSIGTLVRVTRDGRGYTATTTTGEVVTDKFAPYALRNAFRSNKALELTPTKGGGTQWRQVAQAEYDKAVRGATASQVDSLDIHKQNASVKGFDTHDELVSFVRDAMSLKPRKLKIGESWWRFAVRSAIRGENLLVVGPSGCGKTLLANALKIALGREDRFFYVNLGATQDPRSSLIGNTHFNRDSGTYVSLSYFAQAIQVPNALILLDEVSRGGPEAANILMTVLDRTQRYLRVDEKVDTETIQVADGVCFLLTANVGSEYTATRTMDRALLDRCTMFEMQPLGKEDELENLRDQFPDVEEKILNAIVEIAIKTREDIKSESPKVDTIISTRKAEEMAALVHDGFTLAESAEVCVYPYFSDAGGTDSPRVYMRSVVQQYLPTEFDGRADPFKGGDPNKGRATPWGSP